MKATLYDLQQETLALLERIDSVGAEGDGELDADTETMLDRWMADLNRSVEEKVEGYACIIKELGWRAEARKQEADRLRKLVDADEAKVRRLKQRLLEFFTATNTKRVDTEHFRVSVQANGGKLALVVPPNAEELPALYQAVEVKADVDAIRAAIEAGKTVPGCRLLPRGSHVSIR